MSSDFDQANKRVWGSREVIRIFQDREGFSSEAEAHMMRRVATASRGQPVLDVGVGGGRTVAFLRSMSSDYVGIDYVEELVNATRRRYPDVRLYLMDARDLSAFADETFALVNFSRNGIDGVAHTDRPAILHEFHRVLRPRGLLAYSTHNLDYRSRRPPGRRRKIINHPRYALPRIARSPRTFVEYLGLRSLNASGEGWASRVTFGYSRPLIWHRVTFTEAARELGASGFTPIELYSSAGLATTVDPASPESPIEARDIDTSGWPTLHLVAHKPPAMSQ